MNPAWLGSRWIVGAAAWLAFSLVVWFAGEALLLGSARPLDGPFERFALIVAAGVAWLGWELWRARRSLRENQQLLEGIAAGGEGDSAERAAHEVTVLRKRMEEAVEMLRKARFYGRDGERRTVSQLPWYMFIGAPGSGKTTALLNAGLRFPLGDSRGERALQGVGGTRNCDWWFTDEAVLLDTAGRYTTQESDREADAAAWLGFLDLLKRFRPRQPLNGVIITLSATDLVHWSDEEMARYAAHVRARVRELYGRLGVRLPIYVLVTKADLLAGFMEFFSQLDGDGRAQVWGTTFPASEITTSYVARCDEEFARLERRLYAMLPARLQEERDLQRRAAIYRFPQQFRGVAPLVSAFMESTFRSGWSGDMPLVRGVYFASGTQEGSPIDRVLGTLARSFNLERKVQPPHLGSGKSYFLRRLLHEVIFGEAGLAGSDPAEERRQQRVRRAAYAAMATVSVALVAAWTVSYFNNRSLVAAAEERAQAAVRELEQLREVRPGDEARLVAALNALRAVRVGQGSPLMHAGLYQGDKLDAQAERAYRNALREWLLGHLALSLESALRTAPSRDVLDAYVGLHGTPDAKHLEQATLRLWRLPEPARADLAAHLRVALADQPLALPRARDEALIEQSRRKLGAGGKA
jgi:type VI secretion system protein ImpL